MHNVILIGMPGSGKTTLGQALGLTLGRAWYDCDRRIAELSGMLAADYYAAYGEAAFRALETETLAELCAQSGAVISTGGGCVTREENFRLLRAGGTVLWLRRSPALLARDGHLPSFSHDLNRLLEAREPLYRRFADAVIENNGTVADALSQIGRVIEERI